MPEKSQCWRRSCFSPDSSCQLKVFEHGCYSFGMKGAKIGVFEHACHKVLGSHLKSTQSLFTPSDELVVWNFCCDWLDQSIEWCFRDDEMLFLKLFSFIIMYQVQIKFSVVFVYGSVPWVKSKPLHHFRWHGDCSVWTLIYDIIRVHGFRDGLFHFPHLGLSTWIFLQEISSLFPHTQK